MRVDLPHEIAAKSSEETDLLTNDLVRVGRVDLRPAQRIVQWRGGWADRPNCLVGALHAPRRVDRLQPPAYHPIEEPENVLLHREGIHRRVPLLRAPTPPAGDQPSPNCSWDDTCSASTRRACSGVERIRSHRSGTHPPGADLRHRVEIRSRTHPHVVNCGFRTLPESDAPRTSPTPRAHPPIVLYGTSSNRPARSAGPGANHSTDKGGSITSALAGC